MPSHLRSSHRLNHHSGWFVSRHQTLSLLLVLGVAVALSAVLSGAKATRKVESATTGGRVSHKLAMHNIGSLASFAATVSSRGAEPYASPGAALDFDGSNDRVVSVSNVGITGNAQRTLEFWAKSHVAGQSAHLANWGIVNSNNQAFGFFTFSGGLRFYGWGPGDYVTGFTMDTNWHHFAATYDGATVRTYVDGASTPTTNQPRNLNTPATLLVIGARTDGTLPFNGEIDEVRVWNRTLCQSELQNAMNGELTGTETGLVAYYKFNQGDAGGTNTGVTTLTDASPSGNDGTLTNFGLTGATSNWITPGGVVTGTAAPPPLSLAEINIKGNGTSIVDGDVTPSATDDTDFGSTPQTGGTVSHVFIIENTGPAALSLTGSPKVAISGTNAADFTVTIQPTSPVAATNGTTTFTIVFDPSAAGLRTAKLNISNDDCDENAYDFAVQGTGLPSPGLGTYPDTSIALSADVTVTPDTAPTNTTSINVSTSTNFKGTFAANPTTGVVAVTDAHPAGIYTVTVKAFGTVSTTTRTFTLTVTNGTACTGASGFISPATPEVTVTPGNSVAIGDFNGDGIQDLAGTGGNVVSIRLGDGAGGFTSPATPEVTVGRAPISIAIGDFNGDGKQDFATANTGSATAYTNTDSSDVSIRLGDGSGGFTSPAVPEVTVRFYPYAIAIGDFNGDGKQDFAATNVSQVYAESSVNSYVSIRLGDGSGGFTSPSTPEVTVGIRPFSVAIGDFNGDGKQDFAAGNVSSNNVSIRLGDGSGGFTSPATPEVAVGTFPYSVTIGDFNGDGKQDFAVANNGSGTVSIRLGDGSGAFTSPIAPEVTVGNGPYSVAIGDFNGDGKQDFATANLGSGSAHTVSIRFGDGGGAFTLPTTPEVTVGGSSVAIGDFNGDGRQDFAAVSVRLGACLTPEMDVQGGSPLVSIADGDTTPAVADDTEFGSANFTTGSVTHTFTIANTGPGALNLTGTPKVVVGGTNSADFTVTVQPTSPVAATSGTTTFTVVFDPSAPGLRTATLSIANDDADENPYDFAVEGTGTVPAPTLGTYPDTSVALSGNVTVTPNAAPTNTTSISVSTNSNFNGTLTADTSTGVVTVTDAHPAGIYTVTVSAFGPGGSTTGSFTLTVTNGTVCTGASGFASAATPEVAVGTHPPAVAIGDFNGDGKQDFATANSGSSNVSIRLGVGDGTFTSAATPEVTVGSSPYSVAIGDFNGDGKQDFATANSGSANVSIRLGDGSGGFTSPATPEVTIGTSPRSVAIGDFNGDGKPDFATANSGSNNVSIRLGVGDGTFTSPATPQVTVGTTPNSVAIRDFNGDGKPDFAAVNLNSANVSIRLGDGSGGFTSPATPQVTVGTTPYLVAIGDFNGDGKPDFAVANLNSNNVSIRLGVGDGTFTSAATPEVSVGTTPISVAIADFNADGKPDFATTNYTPNNVSIRLGDGSGGFTSPATPEVAVGTNPYSVAIGDFNGDGRQDFAAANYSSNNVSVRLGKCNPAPTITAAAGLSRQQGSAVSNSQIATVTDDGGNGSVTVTVTSTNPSNGVTVSNITNTSGTVRADVVAACGATNASFTLTATDGNSTATATLNLTVTANAVPTLSYSTPQSVGFNGSMTVSPTTATDNGSITGYAVQGVVPALTTAPTVNASGIVSITNAQPAGSHLITIRVTDNCGITTDASFTLNVSKANQTIAVGTHAPASAVFNSNFTVAATSNSSLPVAYSSAGVCTNVGATFTMTSATGACTVRYDQVGDTNYNPAIQVTETVNAQKANQTITVGTNAPSSAIYNTSFTVAATSNSGLAVAYSSVGVCTNVGATFTMTSATGICTVRYDQAGNSNYNPATQVTESVNAQKANQTITLGTHAPASATYNTSFTVAATSNSSLTVSYSSAGVCTNVGATFTMTSGTGTCTVSHDQAGNTNYNPATQVTETVNAQKANQTITFGALPNRTFGSPDFTVSATATSGLTVSFAAVGPCTISGTTVHLTGVGSCAITASQAGNGNFNAATSVPQSFAITGALIALSSSNYSVNESTGFVTITANRTGDLSIPVGVDYATDDTNAPTQCAPVSGNTLASSRCDFGLTLGTLNFAATETQKTFVIPISQDSYSEGPEMFTVNLFNLTGTGAAFATPSSATVTISDSAAPAPNASDDTDAFVRQQYRDFLNREADTAGLAFWTNEINSCGSDAACRDIKRINVSAAFFLSIEFQDTGYFVYRAYKAAYGDATGTSTTGSVHNLSVPIIRLIEFLPDTQRIGQGVIVGQGNWQQQIDTNKIAFTEAFVQRPRFLTDYPLSMTPTQFVDQLNTRAATAGVMPLTPAERDAFVTALTNGTKTRSRVLREVADNQALSNAEFNRAFVLMQFFGYLRRNPNDPQDTDYAGYEFWLGKMNQFNGNFVNAEMVKAFITSSEYRHRFGP